MSCFDGTSLPAFVGPVILDILVFGDGRHGQEDSGVLGLGCGDQPQVSGLGHGENMVGGTSAK